jgi:hypothetical protein
MTNVLQFLNVPSMTMTLLSATRNHQRHWTRGNVEKKRTGCQQNHLTVAMLTHVSQLHVNLRRVEEKVSTSNPCASRRAATLETVLRDHGIPRESGEVV